MRHWAKPSKRRVTYCMPPKFDFTRMSAGPLPGTIMPYVERPPAEITALYHAPRPIRFVSHPTRGPIHKRGQRILWPTATGAFEYFGIPPALFGPPLGFNERIKRSVDAVENFLRSAL